MIAGLIIPEQRTESNQTQTQNAQKVKFIYKWFNYEQGTPERSEKKGSQASRCQGSSGLMTVEGKVLQFP